MCSCEIQWCSGELIRFCFDVFLAANNRLKFLQRSHVVHAVGKFDDQDANILRCPGKNLAQRQVASGTSDELQKLRCIAPYAYMHGIQVDVDT